MSPSLDHPAPEAAKLEVLAATSADIPILQNMIFDCFTLPFFQTLFPRTKALQEWWAQVHESFLSNPSVRVVKAVQNESNKEPTIAGWAIWVLPQDDWTAESPWPEFPPSDVLDHELAEAFFGTMDKMREETMGKKPHYYLNIIGTLPSHQGKGAASALLQWGTSRADQEGLETYLDATPLGQAQRRLYEKGGFQAGHEVLVPAMRGAEELRITSMKRPLKN